jgi:hypothetical protein
MDSEMEEKKMDISAAELYVLLARELRRRQSKPCNTCFIELPHACERLDESGANWTLRMPPDCGGECRNIIEDLVAHYSHLYDLRAEMVPREIPTGRSPRA